MAKLLTTLAERLWSRVDRDQTSECWLWRGCLNTKGYGSIRYNGRLLTTHRVALEVAGFPPPPAPNNHALHSDNCTSRACCNPAHLRWGSNQANVSDRNRLGRLARGEKHGSAKLTEAQVRQIRASTESCAELASKYGVAEVTVGQVRSGRLWGHV